MPRIIFCYSATECYCHYRGQSHGSYERACNAQGIYTINPQISKSKLTWKSNYSISPSLKRQTGDSKDPEISNCKMLLVRETLFQKTKQNKKAVTSKAAWYSKLLWELL